MGLIGKTFAIIMFPLSILIFLESINLFFLDTFIDKVMLGAILMITLQVLTLFMLKKNSGDIKFMNIVTAILFIFPAAYYLISSFMLLPTISYLGLTLSIMMFTEALYALH